MSRTHWMPRMAALMTLVTVAACSDSTGPEEQPFDADVASQDYAAVDLLLTSDAFRDFQNIGVALGGQVSAPSETFDMILRHRDAGRLRAALEGVISPENRGRTFVYDELEQTYLVDTTRTGAPETGVRFIIYGESTTVGRPDVNDERGYADLIDLGDNSTSDMNLRLEGTYDGAQFMEYEIDVNSDSTGASMLEVDGFLADAANRLDFSVDVQSMQDETGASTDMTYRLRVDARNFEVNASLSIDVDAQENTSATVDMSVQHGTDVIRLVAAGNDTAVTGTFSIGGTPFALISGSPEDPTITKADGTELTASEINALSGMFDLVGELFDFFDELLTPVNVIVYLGLSL